MGLRFEADEVACMYIARSYLSVDTRHSLPMHTGLVRSIENSITDEG